jgi:hypothetical protein
MSQNQLTFQTISINIFTNSKHNILLFMFIWKTAISDCPKMS